MHETFIHITPFKVKFKKEGYLNNGGAWKLQLEICFISSYKVPFPGVAWYSSVAMCSRARKIFVINLFCDITNQIKIKYSFVSLSFQEM